MRSRRAAPEVDLGVEVRHAQLPTPVRHSESARLRSLSPWPCPGDERAPAASRRARPRSPPRRAALVPRVADDTDARVAAGNDSVTVGEASEARYRVRDVVVDRLATTFELDVDGSSIGTVRIGTPGRHHARNAATAIAAAATTGVDPRAAADALAAYTGVARRFEVRGSAAGVTVVDDYAHNPGKVRALVSSAVEAGWGRVLVVFQPQRWTRTRDQWRDFGAALTGADLVAVTEVYGAGEPPVEGITGRLILAALLEKRPWASTAWTPTLDDAERWVLANVRPDDLVLTVGAGDVHVLAGRLVDALTARVAAGRPG